MKPLWFLFASVALFNGASAQGIQPRTGDVLFSTEISRGAQGDQFGRAIGVIGDLDGDGVQDLVVGASHDDDGATDSGSVWILFMTPNMGVKAQVKISQTTPGFNAVLGDENWFGKSVAGIGDLDGDGTCDIAVGAPSNGIGSDRAVYILFLQADGSVRDWTSIHNSTNGFARSVAKAGDLDGDGVGELMVGTGFGRVYTYYMNADGSVKSSKTYGTHSSSSGFGSFYGVGMRDIGDWDGDGITDFCIGDTSDDSSASDGGAMFISLMDTDGTVKSEIPLYDGLPNYDLDLPDYPNFGRDAALVGDLDGNGVSDLVIGCSEYYNASVPMDSGAVFVTFLESDGQVLGYKRIGEQAGNFLPTLTLVDEFGISVEPLGDINGDGIGDVAVGARFQGSGSIHILRLNDGSLLYPDARGTAANTQGPLPLDVVFTDTSTGSVSNVLWDFGDGTTSTERNPTHRYLTQGNFQVTLTVNGPGMMTDTRVFPVLVNVQPPLTSIAGFDADPLEGLAPLTVTFSDSSQGGVDTWSWNFGDGDTSTLTNPVHVYSSAGSYAPTLDVDGPLGMDSAGLPAPVIVHPAVLPAAALAPASSAGIVPFDVVFSDQSTGFIDGWLWDFGDGNTSSAPNPTHTYNAAGTYDVSLTVSNALGSDTQLALGAVEVALPAQPLAYFQASPSSGSTPLLVSFSDQSQGQVDSWLWDFGDGTSSTLQNPTHTYLSGAAFDVTLTVTNLGGQDSWTLFGAVASNQTLVLTPYDQGINGTDGASGTGWLMYTAESVPSRFVADPPSFGDVADHLIAVVDLGGVWHYDTNTSYVPFTPRSSDRLLASLDFGADSAQVLVGTDSVVNGIASGYTSGDLNVIPNLWDGGTNSGEFGCTGSFVVIGDASAAPTPSFSADVTAGSVPLLVSFSDLSLGGATSWLWDFGDGSTSSLQNPSHSYASVGSYDVSLTVTNASGMNSHTLPNYVLVTPVPPVASFGFDLALGSAPLSVQFSDMSSGSPSQWAWDFGDGSTSTLQNPAHVFAGGTYTISLMVTNAGGSHTSIQTDVIQVLPTPPTAAFSVDGTLGAAPYGVQFTDLSNDAPSAWSWDFGDGTSSTLQHPSHVYTSAGSYVVSLTASNAGGGDSANLGTPIVVTDAAPGAAYSVDVTSGPAPLSVQFTDTSSGTPTAWAWDFGDGSSSTERNPSHQFLTQGDYSVTLVASNPSGSDMYTLGTPISVSAAAPTASFSADSSGGPAPLSVQFTDSSSGTPTAWAWDFGDGATSSEQHPSHLYTTPGTFVVSLSASNAIGSDLFVAPAGIVVLDPVPVVSFGVDVSSGPAPLAVQFTDSSSQSPTTWAWDFGDGGTSTEQHPSHIYTTPGSYTVSLQASNASGSGNLSSPDLVNVLPPVPIADFDVDLSDGPSPLAVQFSDLSTGSPSAWLWDFGDGSSSSQQNPLHVYTAVGAYSVSLSATGISGVGNITKNRLILVGLTSDITDGGFELSPTGQGPMAPWDLPLGQAHMVQPDGLASDQGLPSEGLNWLQISGFGSVDATPPSNPGGQGAPPVGAVGVSQTFLLPDPSTLLEFDAAFLLAGNAMDANFNDWMSIDITDGLSSVNLYYRDSFSTFGLTSDIHGLPMTALSSVSVDLAQAFPGMAVGAALTLSIQVGNGGDGLEDSLGYVDNIRLNLGPRFEVYGSGINPVGSMQLRGTPQLGQFMYFDMDNPLGTQCPGSTTVYLLMAFNPDPLYPAGALRAGYGMDGGLGENLINWINPADRFRRLTAPVWTGAGVPTTVSLKVPNNPALVSFELYSQGLFVDSTTLCGVQLGLTEAVYLRVGK